VSTRGVKIEYLINNIVINFNLLKMTMVALFQGQDTGSIALGRQNPVHLVRPRDEDKYNRLATYIVDFNHKEACSIESVAHAL
jgi:hypothetical protein